MKFRRPPTRPLSINQAENPFRQRLLIGTPMTGLLRAEWVSARYSQVIPTNWSQVEFAPLMYSHIPLRYQVADAENVIAKLVVEQKFQWLLFIEHDNVLPPGTFLRMNEYMIEEKIPVVGGLYFTKSEPPEPLVYREFGYGYYDRWKLGDKVWVRGLPFGCTLIHGSIIKALWDESPEYVCGNQTLRRVFVAPNEQWFDLETGIWKSASGTSDLHFCERLIKDRIFEKAGWQQYQGTPSSVCTCGRTKICLRHPFLIDTNISVKHIDERGVQYPIEIPHKFLREDVRNASAS